MDILTETFYNTNYNLAICVFPADTLRHTPLEKKLTSYTTFYAHRLNQIVDPNNPIEIYQTPHIEAGLSDLEDEHDHILFLSAGTRISDMSVLYDIKKIIDENEDYMSAGVLRDPGEGWYEIHHSFLLVNVKRWIRAGSPEFGSWEPKVEELPIIRKVEKSTDYFDIEFTGEVEEREHKRQGWKFILSASKNEMNIFSIGPEIRKKYNYCYPEHKSQDFWKSLSNPEGEIADGLINNQVQLIKILKNVNLPKIWLTNTEVIHFEGHEKKKYDTVSLPAAGFKILNSVNYLKKDGKLVIYDYNQYSLDWAKHLYESESDDIFDIIKNWEHREYFYSSGKKVFSDKELNTFTRESIDSINRSIRSFGSDVLFLLSLAAYRKTNVEFVKVNLFTEPEILSKRFEGDTLLSISNIFSTDYSALLQPIFENQKCLKTFVDSIETKCFVTGQDAYCKMINSEVNHGN